MAQNKLELLKQLGDEFEVIERYVHSKKIRLPEDSMEFIIMPLSLT